MSDISEEFQAALCISGGNRRTPQTLSPSDLFGGGGGGGGEEEEEEEEEMEDRLSALPDDVLLLILCRLRSAAAAARTSVLSGRWRRLWAQLPELWFPYPAEPARALPWPASAARTRARWSRLLPQLWVLRSRLPADPAHALHSLASAHAALAQHSAPSLCMLSIIADDADPGDTTAVLRLAAPCLTSTLFFGNVIPQDWINEEMAEAVVRDAIELPCFDRAERLLLNLGYLCLALPPFGVFRKLTELVLSHVRFQGASDIGDTFSSARCPSLRLLSLQFAQGVSHLSICSESLLSMYLHIRDGLQQLTVVSPMLRKLTIWRCFFKSQPVADITSPVLEKLSWVAPYDPRSVQLGKLAQLRVLETSFFAYTSYGSPKHQYNLGNVMLLQRYREISDLRITIDYPASLVHIEYLMEALTLPPVKNLHLFLATYGHHIGSCVFHFLKISTSIRRLFLNIQAVMKNSVPFRDGGASAISDVARWHLVSKLLEKTSCLPGCFCHGEEVWEAEELFLNSLQELHICGFNGSDYDFAFVKRLLGWAGMLKSVNIKFDPQETVDEELCKELLGLSGPKTCMKIYLYRNGAKGLDSV